MTTSMESQTSMGANGAPRQGEQLQQAATGLLDQAARTADAQASTRMTMVGETLVSVSQAVEEAAGKLRESQPDLANFVETGATKLDEVATYLRDHTASEALDSATQIARRQPALVVGGGLIAGLLLGRFLRSGAGAAQGMGGSHGQGGSAGGAYGSGGYGATDYGSGGYGATDYGAGGYEAGRYGVGTTGVDATTGASSSGAAIVGTDVADELDATDAAADAQLDDTERR